MKKINFAIIGYGGQGNWHAKQMRNSDVVNLVGIYDIKDTRIQFAKENGIHAYSSLEELLSDKEIDAVTIATPNDVHKSLSIEAMKSGKHVVCEKPVTLCCSDFQEICDASEKYGKLFTIHQNRRWDCDYLMMKDIYASGKLGNVFNVESRVQGSRGIPGDWRGIKKYGGGMLFDWGVHLIDQMMGIVYDRRIEKLYCRFDHITNDEVDDGFKLDLYFEGGLTARIEVGTSNFISLPRLYMAGTEGSAIINGWTDDCKLVTCEQWHEKDVVPVMNAAGLTKTMAPRNAKTTTESVIQLPESDVHDFYRNFCAAIRGEADMIVTHAQGMRVLKIIEAAFESDRLGAPVEMDDKIV